jgi:hypothetical protein
VILPIYAAALLFVASSASARRYSFGKTLTNCARYCAHLSRISPARFEPVYLRLVLDQTLDVSPRPRPRQQRLEVHHRRVAALPELALDVEHVGEPPDMPAAKLRPVAPARPRSAGHVLAAVVADALDHRLRAGVAHREALAGDAAEIRLAAIAP